MMEKRACCGWSALNVLITKRNAGVPKDTEGNHSWLEYTGSGAVYTGAAWSEKKLPHRGRAVNSPCSRHDQQDPTRRRRKTRQA